MKALDYSKSHIKILSSKSNFSVKKIRAFRIFSAFFFLIYCITFIITNDSPPKAAFSFLSTHSIFLF